MQDLIEVEVCATLNMSQGKRQLRVAKDVGQW